MLRAMTLSLDENFVGGGVRYCPSAWHDLSPIEYCRLGSGVLQGIIVSKPGPFFRRTLAVRSRPPPYPSDGAWAVSSATIRGGRDGRGNGGSCPLFQSSRYKNDVLIDRIRKSWSNTKKT